MARRRKTWLFASLVLVAALAVALVRLGASFRGAASSRSAFPAAFEASSREDPAQRTLSPVRIATWNLEWLDRRSREGKDPRSEADYERLARYARRLDADVVALQEVDGEAAARRVFDPAVYAFHFTGDEENPQRAGFAFRKGLAVAFHPDLKGLAIEGTRRGADLGLSIGGRELRLLSLHLKTGCWEEPLATGTEACRILSRQLPALKKWIDARASEGVPFIVLGDFNRRFEPGDGFWDGIDRGLPARARLTDAMDGRLSRCWGGEFPRYIDHIVLSRQAAGWLVPGSFLQLLYDPSDAGHKAQLSDHCPVRVALSPEGTKSLSPPPPAPGAGRALRPVEAAGHAGETATVCGVVASARYLSDTPRRLTLLNFDRPYPDQSFTLVIRGSDRASFGSPEVAFLHRRICVTGRIEIYRGRPEILATSPSQIVLAAP